MLWTSPVDGAMASRRRTDVVHQTVVVTEIEVVEASRCQLVQGVGPGSNKRFRTLGPPPRPWSLSSGPSSKRQRDNGAARRNRGLECCRSPGAAATKRAGGRAML